MPSVNTALVVIGAGPAGTATAISAAMVGIDCVIVESQPFPRPRVGETLHPGIQPLMNTLGVEERFLSAGFLRHEGTWVEHNGVRRFEAFGCDKHGRWLGFQAWRADFDAILLARAREMGVDVRQPCRAIKPIVKDRRVIGVDTTSGPVHARVVVDAAGSGHWIARHISIPVVRHSPRLIARYCYATSCSQPDELLPAIAADSDGWTWVAKVHDKVYNCTRLSAREDKHRCRNSMRRFLGSVRDSRLVGADVTWRIASATAGLGYLCAGDAACVLDPSSSHGVLRAVMTGMMAAHVTEQMLRHPEQERELQDGYHRWLANWYESDKTSLQHLSL